MGLDFSQPVPSMFGGQLLVLWNIPEQFVRGVFGRVVLLSGGRRPRFLNFGADVSSSQQQINRADGLK